MSRPTKKQSEPIQLPRRIVYQCVIRDGDRRELTGRLWHRREGAEEEAADLRARGYERVTIVSVYW